jgi:group I intron endonuclease
MIIYKITNKLNGKMYIGQTVQKLSDRWSDHCRPCAGKHVNHSAIADAIRKYGKENFILEQIDTAGTLETLDLLEIHYIQKYNTLSPNGYNLELRRALLTLPEVWRFLAAIVFFLFWCFCVINFLQWVSVHI